MTDEARIKRYLEIDDFLKAQSKAFTEFCKPYREEMQAIQAGFLAEFVQTKRESVRTDAGTAYSSTTMTPKVVDREAYLDYCNDHWENGGNEILQLGAPQVTAFRAFMDKHEGKLPPGTDVQFFTHVNIRRS
jgi:hypothetical protein